ncbi:GNAT family N-acetyltransferase [Streptomyces sp. NPDC059618]|uniref:GNAT family N-acetyltransferase n=1 Tax=Streptomyces sp. NPDC059618 TaxID=3346887 RepID=UPI0036CC834C
MTGPRTAGPSSTGSAFPLGGGVFLRLAHERDAAALYESQVRNRDHLRPWEPRRHEEFYTRAGQAARLAEQLRLHRAGRAAPWVLTRSDAVVGMVTLTDILPAPFFGADLGYWLDRRYTGRGLATAAVRRVCELAETEFGLHRLEAATALHNTASQQVLVRCGFRRIGVARGRVQTDGAWTDVVLHDRVLHDRPPGL